MSTPGAGTAHEEVISFSQEDFDAFARLSGDDNPIHVDPEFAGRTHFGRTVAHGMMLFGALSAAASRWLEEPLTIHIQDLMFPAPTFAGTEHRIRLEVRRREPDLVVIGQAIVTGNETETAIGEMVAWDGAPVAPPTTDTLPPAGPDEYKGLRLGMTAAATRRFQPAEVEEFCALIDERYQPDRVVPPALLGGTVSHLLGVELPGPGANWLKQRYEFLRPVLVGEEVRAEVELVRFRPEKYLVDLSVQASVNGTPVVVGRSLIHAQDIEPR